MFTPVSLRSTIFNLIISLARDIDVLKLDIEGTEWPAMAGMTQFDELDKVKQLLVEFHLGSPDNLDRLRRGLRVLKEIARAGFRKFFATKNPKGSFHHPHFPVMRAKNYEVHFLNPRFLKNDGLNPNLRNKNR